MKRLDEAFRRMDLARQEAGGAGAKFQLFKASAGTVEDFHAGLGARIGQSIRLGTITTKILTMVHDRCARP